MALETLLPDSIVLRALVTTVLLLVLYPCSRLVYNLYFHPLAKYPGPLFWRATRLAYVSSVWSGTLHSDVQAIHYKYGDIVRIAPDEISFARADAWDDVYTNRGGRPAFPKSKLWHGRAPGCPMSILNALEPKDHSRCRRAMEPAFTEKALISQEPIIQSYVELLISKLRNLASASSDGAVVNIVEWYNFVTFDIIGDLGFGESFDCLKSNQYHPWMSIIFNSLRAATLSASLRYYPWVGMILGLAVPESVKKKAEEHRQLAVDKVNRRLASDKDRPDFISLFTRTKSGKEKDGLSLDEIQANSNVVIVAGSETTVTTISGTTNHLIHNPDKLTQLTAEVRSKFQNEKNMTIAALKDLPYLNAVLLEGLRMCNPTPVGLPRIVPEGGGVVSGHFLPANTFVNVHPLALSFSPEHFHNPKSFAPERWLASAKSAPSSPYYNDDRDCVHPFGVGPRVCIGKPLAWAELRLMMARIVWAFDLEKVDSEAGRLRWESQRVFSVVEKKPFEVKLVVRKA